MLTKWQFPRCISNMGKSNKIVPQSMCNWLLLMIFVLQFIVSLLVKNVWSFLSKEPIQLHYYILIIEVFAVALPMFLLCAFNGSEFSKTFGCKIVRFSNVWKCLCLGFCLQPVAMVANSVWQMLFDIKSATGNIMVSPDAKNFVLTFVFACVVPAFCEEFLIRGMYISAVKRKGYIFAIVSSTAMFVLLHSDVSLVAAHTILGLVTALVVVGTGSVYSGVLVHIAFNMAGIITDVIAANTGFVNNFAVCIVAATVGLFWSLMLLKRIDSKKSKRTEIKDFVVNLFRAFFNLPILIIRVIYIYRIVG